MAVRVVPLLCLVPLVGLALWEYAPREAAAPPQRRVSTAAVRTGACEGSNAFLVGSGRYDITGPASELGMMGYGSFQQRTGGIHTRLWARAFVVASPCNDQRVVFVSADLLNVSQGVKQQVVERLQRDYGALYSDENVMLSATHTHGGPGGYSHYALYNITVLGFDAQNFEAIVDGIHRAIRRAHEDLAPGEVRLAVGELHGVSANRSRTAYLRNPPEERARYPDDTDKEMVLLKVDRANGHPVGMVNWFAVHATSMHNDNTLITADNKGYASSLFERHMGVRAPDPSTFVAAFAQSNAGDVTPNVLGGTRGLGADDVHSTAISGRMQFERALELYVAAREQLQGGVDFRHTYVAFDDVQVRPEFGGGEPRHTCPAAVGVSMFAGAEDGPGIGREGVRCGEAGKDDVPWTCVPFTTACQGEKPIALEMGTFRPYPWSPEVLPVQVFRLGQLAVVGVPFEMTTMAGRRLRDTVQSRLRSAGVTRVVLASLANAYAGYVATREEYGLQHYEGASTHFGPWTLAALQQEADRVAESLSSGTDLPEGPHPRDLRDAQLTLQTGVVLDSLPLFGRRGALFRDALPSYQPGETASAIFWGAHPKNDLRRQDSYLRVERREGDHWVLVATDDGWETRYRWQRGGCFGCSLVTVEWDVPQDTPAGQYRLRVFGAAKALGGVSIPYEGSSRTFTVESARLTEPTAHRAQ